MRKYFCVVLNKQNSEPDEIKLSISSCSVYMKLYFTLQINYTIRGESLEEGVKQIVVNLKVNYYWFIIDCSI